MIDDLDLPLTTEQIRERGERRIAERRVAQNEAVALKFKLADEKAALELHVAILIKENRALRQIIADQTRLLDRADFKHKEVYRANP
jgi:hypothetical protein